MRAVVVRELGPAAKIAVEANVLRPRLGPSEIEIAVKAASINPLDRQMIEGYGRTVFKRGPGLPFIPGRDCSGIVSRVGPQQTRFKEGDEVVATLSPFSQGALAEFCAVDARYATAKPTTVSHGNAAAIAYAGLTGFEALTEVARVERGMNVFIHGGSGALGCVGIQLCRWKGATVTATCSKVNLPVVKKLGATAIDHAIFSEDDSRWKELSKGFDVVLDASGGRVPLETSYALIRRGGAYVTLNGPLLHLTDEFGTGLGTAVGTLDLMEHKWRAANRHGVRYEWALYHPNGEHLAVLMHLAAQGLVAPAAYQTMPLDAVAAYLAREPSETAPGKVVAVL